MPIPRLLILLSLMVLGCPCISAQYKGAKPLRGPMKAGFDDIDEQQLREWLGVIASDEFEGRETGKPGYDKAAKYVAGLFKDFGLKPLGENGSYYQTVTLYRLRKSRQPNRAVLQIGEDKWHQSKGLRQVLSHGDAEAKVVFVAANGKKVRAKNPEIFKDCVLILNATRTTALSPLFRQIRDHRPQALILKSGTPNPLGSTRPNSLTQEWIAATPTLEARESVLAAITRSLGLPRGGIAKPQKNSLKIHRGEKSAKVHCEADHEIIKAPNVIGIIEGRDPKLKKEVVICGSHLDHIGISPSGEINNGADDDGSGTTSLLAAARAMARTPLKPKRSVVFIAVCGEEKGLLGSEYYVENPIIPLKDTICELQMDMVGRNEESSGELASNNVKTTHLVGTKRTSVDLHKLIIKMNKYVGFRFEFDSEDVWNRSDHYNFAKKGIPIAFVFSGFHYDYHKPTDTIEKINFVKIANTAKLFYLTAYAAADRSKRIQPNKKR